MSFVILNHGVILVHDQRVVYTLTLKEWEVLTRGTLDIKFGDDWLPRWLKGVDLDEDKTKRRRHNGRPRN
jgi:hypothetical protein